MDLGYLINILLRRKWLLLSVALVSSLATYFLVDRLPETFKAKAVVATGIIDYKGVSLQTDNPFIQQFQIESSFNSLIEKMKSRTTIKLLSDTLLLHDLQEKMKGSSGKPFRVPEEEEIGLSNADLDNVVLKLKASYTDSLLNKKPYLSPDNKLAETYGYDFVSLWEKLEIKRIGDSDYLSVEYESENPSLSFFVVNSFLEKFFHQHEKDVSASEDRKLDFATKQFNTRQAELDSINRLIDEYKNANSLVDVTSQREGVVSHIRDLELRLEESRLQIPALKSNITSLEKQIVYYRVELGPDYSDNILYRDDINEIDNEIKVLQDRRAEEISSGKSTAATDRRIEGLRTKLSGLLYKIIPVDKKLKQQLGEHATQLLKDKIQKELELEQAQAAFNSYQREINRLQGKANLLTLNNNQLGSLLESKDLIDKEYMAAKSNFELAKSRAEGVESPLAIIEAPEFPFESEPKHRAVFSAFAGIAGGSIASVILFLLAFIDSTLQSPSQFQRATKLPLLGHVNKVKVKNMNLSHLFLNIQSKQELEVFKENIRKIRTAIEGSGAKSILFASPKAQEGKSFLMVMLAYALSLNDKKILIIDTNFKHNTLSGYKTKSIIEVSTDGSESIAPQGAENGLGQLTSPETAGQDVNLKNIDIVANKGGSQSPAEVLAGKNFKKVIEQYSSKYDFVFMEAASLNKYSDARELLPFADKIIVVMSSESPIGNEDKDTLAFLQGLEGKMLGGILNKVDLKNI